MKKLFILAIAIFALTQANAFEANEILENKNLSKQINTYLKEIAEKQNKPYSITGLLYIGPATLKNQAEKLMNKNFILVQKQGYITYEIQNNASFDSYSLEVIPNEAEANQDPHRTETYNIVVKFFKGKKQTKEILKEVIELNNAVLAKKGIFYTNLAVNAEYRDGRFYIPEQEPNTCGKTFDIRTGSYMKKERVTVPMIEHHCQEDPYHCDCPAEMITADINVPRKTNTFTVSTQACRENSACACPQYLAYID